MRTAIIVAFTLLATSVQAQRPEPPDSHPYARLYGQMEMTEGIGLELLQTRVVAYPKVRGGELPDGLVYTVVTADGPQEFEADEYGTAVLPYRKDWVEAAYEITSNFPGEIHISTGVYPKSLPNRIRYRDLMAYVVEFQRRGIALDKKWGGGQAHAVGGVMMRYNDTDNARAVVEAAWGDEVVEAGEHGWLEMRVDYVLLAENPWVELPGRPDTFYGFSG